MHEPTKNERRNGKISHFSRYQQQCTNLLKMKNETEKFHIFSISTAMHKTTKNEKRNGKISHFLDINSNARTH